MVIFFILSVLALVFQTPFTIFLLIFGQIAIWVFNHYRNKDHIKTIKNTAKQETKVANVRADEAYDNLVKLINAIPSPLVYINQKGDFEVSNQYFNSLIKVDAESVYDIDIDTVIRQTLLDAFLNERQFVKQLNYRSIDFQVLSIPLMVEGNRYNGCMLIFQDITRVLEGEKMQKRFIADASHELRTPIASIKGMIEIMNRPNFNDEETRTEFNLQIEKEANRLEHMVEDLLLQSRLKSKQVYLEKTRFNLKQFFDSIVYEKRQALYHAKIETIINCPEDLVVYADQFRLTQVFTNLINNAINYAPDGTIEITAIDNKDRVIIEFKDNGMGIKEDMIPHIFERFYRGEGDRSREKGGSGLGLAISKSIIEAHGGSIRVESEYQKGSSFIIELKTDA